MFEHIHKLTQFSSFNTLYSTNHSIREPKPNQYEKEKKPLSPRKTFICLLAFAHLQVSRALKIAADIIQGKSYANGFQTQMNQNNNTISHGNL